MNLPPAATLPRLWSRTCLEMLGNMCLGPSPDQGWVHMSRNVCLACSMSPGQLLEMDNTLRASTSPSTRQPLCWSDQGLNLRFLHVEHMPLPSTHSDCFSSTEVGPLAESCQGGAVRD